MNQTQEIEIFSTGMTTDLRKVIRVNRKILRPFQSLQHFDVYPDRLVPKRDWVLDSGAVSNLISRYNYFDDGSGNYALWGLGLDGSNHVQLLHKAAGSFTGGWSTATNGIAISSATSGNPFLFGYKGYQYFMTSSGLARYNVSTNAMTEAWQAGFSFSVMPVIHPRTGAAYFFSANSVYEVDPPDMGWRRSNLPSEHDNYVSIALGEQSRDRGRTAQRLRQFVCLSLGFVRHLLANQHQLHRKHRLGQRTARCTSPRSKVF